MCTSRVVRMRPSNHDFRAEEAWEEQRVTRPTTSCRRGQFGPRSKVRGPMPCFTGQITFMMTTCVYLNCSSNESGNITNNVVLCGRSRNMYLPRQGSIRSRALQRGMTSEISSTGEPEVTRLVCWIWEDSHSPATWDFRSRGGPGLPEQDSSRGRASHRPIPCKDIALRSDLGPRCPLSSRFPKRLSPSICVYFVERTAHRTTPLRLGKRRQLASCSGVRIGDGSTRWVNACCNRGRRFRARTS